MPRATNNVAARQRRKKVLSAAKGYRLGKSRLYKTAKDQVEKSLLYAYRDRRTKKRNLNHIGYTFNPRKNEISENCGLRV